MSGKLQWKGKVSLSEVDGNGLDELRDIQLWGDLGGLEGTSLSAIAIVDPTKVPLWRLQGKPWTVYSQSSHARGFFRCLGGQLHRTIPGLGLVVRARPVTKDKRERERDDREGVKAAGEHAERERDGKDAKIAGSIQVERAERDGKNAKSTDSIQAERAERDGKNAKSTDSIQAERADKFLLLFVEKPIYFKRDDEIDLQFHVKAMQLCVDDSVPIGSADRLEPKVESHGIMITRAPTSNSGLSAPGPGSKANALLDRKSMMRRSRSTTPFEVAAIKKKKQQSSQTATAYTVPPTASQLSTKEPDLEPDVRLKKKIQSVVLSALRLRDADKTTPDYRAVARHTYQGVVFALRAAIQSGQTDIELTEIHDKTEALLNLFLPATTIASPVAAIEPS